ncbi:MULTISPECIES: type II toxin-antitoxin system RelE/ParE family toxin [Pantoea]|uniref:type II toxin-antitoxin system RelE/ParE family toxin n=1 Tax=Pantoea TaxID=53335 RepID=UPI000CDCF2DC|nr:MULTISPECIES: type II toxin-antitoxin system RelE/ParE family toxin [Pantoea]POW55053.1 hypothetical protein C3408_20585 [Pantoea alvi]UBN54498.1 type II toxin-antitoxin system RelE/ParE family toxin [Pantoea agglomerans]
MGVYLTPEFDAERRRLGITDKILCKTAQKVFSGLKGSQLGKFTYKRRIALPKVSERDGARSIVFFNDGEHLYFFYLYAKSSLTKKKGKEIEDAEIDIFCSIAPDFIEMDQNRINALLKEKELFEVNCDE